MLKCVIWGTSVSYDKYINLIKFEEFKGNIEVLAVVSHENINTIDEYKVINADDIKKYNFDYIIVNEFANYKRIKEEIMSYGINEEKIVNAIVFELPKFDFLRYHKIRKSEITIISNHCWGVGIYSSLGLKYNSPFINLFIRIDDYIRLLNDFNKYMEMPLEEVKDCEEADYPIAMLGDVKIHFLHYKSYEEAAECWKRRVKRINYNNLFIEVSISKDVDNANNFADIPFDKKICFIDVGNDYKSDEIITLNEFMNNEELREIYEYEFGYYLYDSVKIKSKAIKPYDILKLLNGEKGYMRRN